MVECRYRNQNRVELQRVRQAQIAPLPCLLNLIYQRLLLLQVILYRCRGCRLIVLYV